uniref:SP-RING-type domain-containing protein n=1 Tax=Corethron hystrix TaxID=216773 RepID=A0A7S1BKZ1_9STRA
MMDTISMKSGKDVSCSAFGENLEHHSSEYDDANMVSGEKGKHQANTLKRIDIIPHSDTTTNIMCVAEQESMHEQAQETVNHVFYSGSALVQGNKIQSIKKKQVSDSLKPLQECKDISLDIARDDQESLVFREKLRTRNISSHGKLCDKVSSAHKIREQDSELHFDNHVQSTGLRSKSLCSKQYDKHSLNKIVQEGTIAEVIQSYEGNITEGSCNQETKADNEEYSNVYGKFNIDTSISTVPSPNVSFPKISITTENPLPSRYLRETFAPDRSQNECRPRCNILYNTRDFFMLPQEKKLFDERLLWWSPHVNVIHDMTTCGYVTAKIRNCPRLNTKFPPISICVISFSCEPKYLEALRLKKYKILIRMLPLRKSNYSNSPEISVADNHTWPKGTFLEVNNRGICHLKQRKRQQLGSSKWKGLCEVMDISNFVVTNKYSKMQKVKILTKDPEAYGVQIAVVEHYDSLFISRNFPRPSWTCEQSLSLAKTHMQSKIVVIEDEGLKCTEYDSINSGMSLILQLTCLLSRKVMKMPVRGLKCKHIQCFDLLSFLEVNYFSSVLRWKCPICEDFVSVHELVKCGLFESLILINSENIENGLDRIKLDVDGNWTAVPAKRRGVPEVI